MSNRSFHPSRSRKVSVLVDVDVTVADILDELSDGDLLRECVARRLIPDRSEGPGSVVSVQLTKDDVDDIFDHVRVSDFEGAMLHMERLLPRYLRVFSPLLARPTQGAH